MAQEQIKGYLICETATASKPVIISDSKSGSTTIETILQDADIPNRNKRLYSLPVLTEAVNSPYMQERFKTKTLYGEAGHPIKPDMERQLYIDQTRISHIITKTWFEKNVLHGYVESALTSCGKDFQGLIRQGSQVAFSMRGVGPITENKREYMEIKSPLSIFTWDWVIHPSHSTAYMKGIVSESTLAGMAPDDKILSEGVFMPLNYQEVKSYLVNESRNIKLISEQFEIDKGAKVIVNEDRRTVDVLNGNERFRIFLEDYIRRELDDYFLSL